jgi:Uma2 family endonuclease
VEAQQDAGAGLVEGAPALVLEVLSPKDRLGAVQDKVSQWLEAGSGAVVVVERRRSGGGTLLVHQPEVPSRLLHPGEVLELPDVAPGLRIPVAELFAG